MQRAAILMVSIMAAMGTADAANAATLSENGWTAISLLDELGALVALLLACLLIDRASWSFLTGHKRSSATELSDHGARDADRSAQ